MRQFVKRLPVIRHIRALRLLPGYCWRLVMWNVSVDDAPESQLFAQEWEKIVNIYYGDE